MAVTNEIAQVLYVGDNLVTNFFFGYYFIDPTDLTVTLLGTDGSLATQRLNVDYTLSGTLTDGVYKNGAVINFAGAPGTGVVIYIARHTPMIQPSVFTDGEALPAKSIENALDRIILIIEELGANFKGRTTAAPADGTYNTSDWFIVHPPLPGGPRFLICCNGGTPGDWYECAPISLLPVVPTPGGGGSVGGSTFIMQGVSPVPANSESHTVVFPKPAPDANYFLDVSTTWNTTWWIVALAPTGFTVMFSTPAPNDNSGRVYWQANEVEL